MKHFLPLNNASQAAAKIFLICLLIVFTAFTGRLYAQNCSVNAGITQTVCADEPIFLQGNASGAYPEGGSSAKWSQVGGPKVTIVDPEDLNTEITNVVPGNTYTFRLSDRCEDGSLVFQDVQVIVSDITQADAGTGFGTACPGEDVGNLDANEPDTDAGETGQWTVVSGSGVDFDDPTSHNTSVDFEADACGEATLRWTITSDAGCVSFDDVVVINRGGETPVSAGADQFLSECYSTTQSTNLDGSFGGCGIDGQIGTWSYVSGPNVPHIVDKNNNTTEVTGLVEGTYIFRWTVVGDCANGEGEVAITVPPPVGDVTNANAGENIEICDESITEVVLEGNAPQFSDESVEWTQTAGPPNANIQSPNSPVTVVSGLVPGESYTFEYTIINDITGCNTDSSITVSYLEDPPVLTIESPDPLLLGCNETSATIDLDSGGSGSNQFRIVSGPQTEDMEFPTGWSGASDNEAEVEGLTSIGTYVIQLRRVTAEGIACETTLKEISVVTSLEPTEANAGTPQILDCFVTETTLAGNAPAVGEGTWSQLCGPICVTLVTPGDPGLAIDNLVPGLFEFQWQISGGPTCDPSTDIVTVLVAEEVPTAQSAGEDQTVCIGTPVYLDADPPEFIFETATWTVEPTHEGIIFSYENDPQAVVEGLNENTDYTFTWTISNGCGEVSETVIITTTDEEGPVAANAGADICLLTGDENITLDGNEPTDPSVDGVGTWSLLEAPAGVETEDVVFDDENKHDAIVSMADNGPFPDGDYVFEWRIELGDCSPTFDTVLVTVSEEITDPDLDAEVFVCGTEVLLTGAEPSAEEEVIWEQVSGNLDAAIVSPTHHETMVTDLSSGTYKFEYTIFNGACSKSETITLRVSDTPPSEAEITEAPDVCNDNTSTLEAVEPVFGTGAWSVISGPNTPNIDDPGSATTDITGLIFGTYVVQWKVTSGNFCDPEIATATFSVVPEADAGEDKVFCDPETVVNLVGTNPSEGTWTLVDKPEGAEDPEIITTSPNTAKVSDLEIGQYTFQYDINIGDCSSSDEMTVTIYGIPTAANAGPDQEFCNETGLFELTGNPPLPEETGLWTQITNLPGDFDDASANETTWDDPEPGFYVFEWSISTGPGCTSSDRVRIENYEDTEAQVIDDEIGVVCAEEVQLNAVPISFGTGVWTFEDGPEGVEPVIENPGVHNTWVTGLEETGSYSFVWTVTSNDVCESTSAILTVEVETPITVASAGDDQEFCETSVFELNGNDPNETENEEGEWSLIDFPAGFDPASDGSFSDANDPSAVYTLNEPITTGSFTFVWTISRGEICESFDEVTFTNYEDVVASINDEVTDFCFDDDVMLYAEEPSIGTGFWTQPQGQNALIVSPEATETEILNIDEGTFEFFWTVTNGACSDTESIEITLSQDPSQARIIGGNAEVCEDSDILIMEADPLQDGESGLWEHIDGPTQLMFTEDGENITEVSGFEQNPTDTLEYRVRWTVFNGNGICATEDEVSIFLYQEPSDAEITTTDLVFCNETVFDLDAQEPTLGTGRWTREDGPSGTFDDRFSHSTTFFGAEPGTYVFRWTTINGACTDFEEITIENYEPITIIEQPEGVQVCPDGTHTMQVSVEGGSGSYEYEWQEYDESAEEWTTASGPATNDSYTTPPLNETTQYRVIINDLVLPEGDCANIVSDEVSVEVVDDPEITEDPQDAPDICTSGEATFSVTATGGTDGNEEGVDYQWQYDDGGDWVDVSNGTPAGTDYSGANAATMTVSGFDDPGTYQYRVEVSATGSGCVTVFSDPASVTVEPNHEIDDQPVGATICIDDIHTMDVTIDENTGTGNYNYLWQQSPTGDGDWTAADGTNDEAGYTTPPLSETTYYRVLVDSDDSGCSEVISDVAPVYIPHITEQPVTNVVNDEVCVSNTENIHEATLTVQTEPGDPGNPIQYEYTWQYNDGGTWEPVTNGIPSGASYSNEDTPSMTIEGIDLEGPYEYRVLVNPSDPDCTEIESQPITLTVVGDPEITEQPAAETTICPGETAELTVVAIEGTPELLYQWQISTVPDPYDWTDISNATNPTYETEELSETTYYRVEVTAAGSGCATTFSVPSTVIVNRVTDPGAIAEDQTICEGETPDELTSIAAADGDGDITYQWQDSDDGVDFTDISGAEGLSYQPPALTQDTWYRRMAISTLNDVDCELTSSAVLITVNPIPQITSANEVTICDQTSVNYTPTSDVDGTTFTWTASTEDDVTGFTESGTGNIDDVLTNNEDGDITAVVTYEITPIGPDPTNCEGESFTLTVNVEKCADLEIEKTVDIETPDVGDEVTFTLTMTNNGLSDATGVTVTDNLPSGYTFVSHGTPSQGNVTVNNGDISWDIGDMASGDEETVTITVTVNEPVADYVNIAIVTGNETDTNPDNNEDDEETDPVVNPAIELEKVSTTVPNEYDEAGQTLTYDLVVTNTGNVTLTDIEVVDPDATVTGSPIASLAPGATETLTASYTVTQADLDNGEFVNTAEATGTYTDTDGETDTVSDDDSETIPAVQNPSIVLEKSADPQTYATAGEEITYTFTVTNDGNVTLTEVSVDDPLDGLGAISPGSVTLAPNESQDFTAIYTITQADLDNGQVLNTATAEGEDPGGQPVSDDDDETVTGDQMPELAITKTIYSINGDPEITEYSLVDDELVYVILVENTGNVTLEDIEVTDDLTGDSWNIAILAPNESESFTTSVYVISQNDIDEGTVINTATAETTFDEEDYADEDTEEVLYAPPIPIGVWSVFVTLMLAVALVFFRRRHLRA